MSNVYLHRPSDELWYRDPEECERKLARMKKWLKDEFGIETLEQLKAAIKAEKPVDLRIFVSPIYEKSESAIYHINEADLILFIKSNRQITGRVFLKSIHQHPQDPWQLCVDLRIAGRGLYAAIVRYDPDLCVPVDVPAFESVTAPSVFY